MGRSTNSNNRKTWKQNEETEGSKENESIKEARVTKEAESTMYLFGWLFLIAGGALTRVRGP